MLENKENVLTNTEKISVTLLIIIGLVVSTRGIYWITNYQAAVHESVFYEALDKVAPLYVWGAPFLIGGILIIIASLLILNQSAKKLFDIIITIGGTISGFSFLLIAMASMSNSLNWLTPALNTIFTVGFFTLSWIGIISLWKNRQAKKN